ncbi:aquaporin-like protein [Cristinia sonorae]|uniref:Aquaporin-like protein n=1 Tax=Cristinia sonorae TaxID=1940300 RepID=A0A8K0XQ58_9AGAR|nr:aquaporin-like protein [Cristinia sonorae]
MTERRAMFSTIRNDLQAALLEFVGTTFFLTSAFGGVQAVTAEATDGGGSVVDRDMKIALSFGFSLLVAAWLFFRVTGGLFNPQVSLALLLCGVITPVRFVLYCIAQLAGGITAAALVLGLTPGPLQSNTHLASGVNPAQGLFIEAFITAGLCLAVLMLAAEKHVVTPFAPVGIGLTLFVGHLFAVYYTGAGTNTARSFGPAVVTGFPYGTQWIYWLGPTLGAVFAACFYGILKHYRYWTLNPGQDTTDESQSPPDPIKKVATRRRLGSTSTAGDSHASNGEQEMSHSGSGAGVSNGGVTPPATRRANDSPV